MSKDNNIEIASKELIGKVFGHQLKQEEIPNIINILNSYDKETANQKLADILRNFAAVLEIGQKISESLSLDVLLPQIVEILSRFLNAQRATVFLIDKSKDELYSRVAQGDLVNEIRIKSNDGIAGMAFTNKESIIINDAYSDSRFNPEVDKKTGFHTNNILTVPMRTAKGDVVGVAQVLNKNSGNFTSDDLALVDAITRQTSSFFINAQLHEEIKKIQYRESQLLEITTSLAQELNLKPLLQKIMEVVTTILNAERSSIFLYDPKTKELCSHVAQGVQESEIRFPCSTGIAGSVFTSRNTINIEDAYQDERFNKEFDRKTGYKTNTILCMPIINKKDEAIGVIQVLNKLNGFFVEDDENSLKAFCSQSSIAIENAQLFEEIMNIKNYNENILESMSNGVLSINSDNIITKGNSAIQKLLRHEHNPDYILGKNIDKIFIEKNHWILETIQQVKENGRAYVAMDVEFSIIPYFHDEFPNERRREKAFINLSVIPLFNTQKEHIGCIIIMEDISKEKRIRGTMARYIPKELTDKLLNEDNTILGGTTLKTSILFSDIRNFTSISEKMSPQEVVYLLNEYFTIMLDIIDDHEGILDKFIGDAIMAVFGVPFKGDNDADNSVQTAIKMIKALKIFNAIQASKGKEKITIGIGINTEEVLSGNIGSMRRMDYTVIGDGVNLASRIESANKTYGTSLLISEFTFKELKVNYHIREVDIIKVKGKEKPVAIYQVLDYLNDDNLQLMNSGLPHYRKALQLYRNQKWDEAIQYFKKFLSVYPKDQLSKIYIKRCEIFMTTPPSQNWEGVWVMKSK